MIETAFAFTACERTGTGVYSGLQSKAVAIVRERLHVGKSTIGQYGSVFCAGGTLNVGTGFRPVVAGVVHLPPIVKIHVCPSVVCEACFVKSPSRINRVFLGERPAAVVPAVPAHGRRERKRVSHAQRDCGRRLAVGVFGGYGHGVASFHLWSDTSQNSFSGIKDHTIRQILGCELHGTLPAYRYAEDDFMSGTHSPHFRTVELRFWAFRRRKDAYLLG